MAHDEALAQHIREALDERDDVTERAMFGGLAFMVGGHMTAVASGRGVLMVRIDPTTADELLATTAAVPADMKGRQLRGWLDVGPAAVGTAAEVSAWVARAVDDVETLPPKAPVARRRQPRQ